MWLLIGAGFQVSEPYATVAACQAAQENVAIFGYSPEGRMVERTYPCIKVRP